MLKLNDGPQLTIEIEHKTVLQVVRGGHEFLQIKAPIAAVGRVP